jgi:hypothetical protein
MKTNIYIIFATAGLLLISCSNYPMGMNKAQWEALPAAQQADYQARQYAIDQERAQQQAAEQARRAQEQRVTEEQERRRIEDAYRKAVYGEIVTVTIQGGMVAFYGKRFPFEPLSFDLVRGESRLVEFIRQGRSNERTEVEVRLSENGNTFYFDYPARKRFVAVDDGWERGREYGPPEIGSHDGHSEAIGVTIRIRYKSLLHATTHRKP